MNKNKLIQIRVNEQEHQFLLLKMQEQGFNNLSDYMRTSAIKPFSNNSKKINSFLYEINKIGVNLNQITHKMHKNKVIDNNLSFQLKEINDSLVNLINSIERNI